MKRLGKKWRLRRCDGRRLNETEYACDCVVDKIPFIAIKGCREEKELRVCTKQAAKHLEHPKGVL